MWNRLSIAAAAALMTGTVGVNATELPTYEIMGFPITPHQLVTLGPANAQQEMPTAGRSAPVLAPRQGARDEQFASNEGRAITALALSPVTIEPAR
ncbi:hypothetical protein SAMN05216337_104294 [Bradyrhizobium brasilense]|uniref:Uncharacterized protein n=1 Tax=Bradyrhizobium brasilense TaxID=1419277 RepID=A0A1G7HQQ7_9BRAD|nr:hypothetical protein [Bradyrhizobium brasilense]SDF02614.1 hypothetical protein SAMN05216337_104294 [Bradyrhizobium brasilense]